MSECHFWWKAGETQWCDMMGEACQCCGWEENCSMRAAESKHSNAQLVAQVQPANTEKQRSAGQRKLKRSA